jgi:hypothetical protein
MGVTPYQHREMLESDTNFAWIFDDMPISWGHKVDEWRDRWGWDNGIGRIDDRYRRTAQRRRADDFAVDPQGTGTEAVFAIKPFQDLVDEAGGEWELIKRPPFDPKVHLQRRWIARLQTASSSLDQTKVSGAAAALSCDSREPGTISSAGSGSCVMATRVSRNELLPAANESGADNMTRPRKLPGSKAAKMAANVPPRECPIKNGLAPPAAAETSATAWPIDRTA